MDYIRHISSLLNNWSDKPKRLPLIVLGARQVGKTHTIKRFCESKYRKVIELNFESNATLARLFSEQLDPEILLSKISITFKTDINPESDILFLDEIQMCPRALTALKYFAERLPELAVIAAGSLLGITLSDNSFPVGKVEHLTMRPLSFAEFLDASDNNRLLDYINNFNIRESFDSTIHAQASQLFRRYLFCGGMPAVIKKFLAKEHPGHAELTAVRLKQNELIAQYVNDFSKHSGKLNAMHLDRVFKSVAQQLGQTVNGSVKRFKFRGAVPGIAQYSRLVSAFDWLERASLIHIIPITSHVEIPLSAYVKESIFKAYIFDVGILGALLDSPPEMLINNTIGSHKGYLVENFICQELVNLNLSLYGWTSGMSEIEFLIQTAKGIVPVEVKAGRTSKAKSLAEFIRRHNPPAAIIFGDTLPRTDKNTTRLPWYFAKLIGDYI